MNQVYRNPDRITNRGGHAAHSWRVIEAARELVPTIDLADLLAVEQGSRWRKAGVEWLTNCVLPDHQDESPSFYVDPEQNLWHCFGCVRGGDVVRLACYVWGYVPRTPEEVTAAAHVLSEFGHNIPERPKAWYAKQERQKKARAAFSQIRVGVAQRRLYEILRQDQEELGNPDPTEAERQYMWEGAGIVASLLVGDRENKGRGAA